jgi:diguanylate cyclase (GGDEF)-like protein
VVQVEDIGDRKQTERELRRLADHDSLTGLLNRRGFMEGMRRELRRMERKGEYGALLLLDLDNFKIVNDTAGHLAGDQVLRSTADVLRRRLRATDVIGRLGGDEFAVLILNVTPRQAKEIAAEITETLRSMKVTAGDVVIGVAASIGVVPIDELHDENEEDLLAAADRAMYRVKSLRRSL